MQLPLLVPTPGPLELGVILVIVILIFGVGRLPEVGGAIGRSLREFRKATKEGADEPAAAKPSEASADAVYCGDCGAQNKAGQKFCSACGHALTAPVS